MVRPIENDEAPKGIARLGLAACLVTLALTAAVNAFAAARVLADGEGWLSQTASAWNPQALP
jgi:hypothetical protein